ncbi:flagellar biosynthesis anti-sigma factor FlgM [Sulfurospirillum arcachonense]|uniref:flagellar biosynthesis anti-sigma factor FlgM n=1 Tax=Sulfurospirillum arcachonense TaxID=57666 RepID=UPI000469C9D1|nr:flagellar biosynthesis anti-sigma factor FlgM [Sulfurospirillum arcachonense]
MISKVAAGSSAYLQQVNSNNKKESTPVDKPKEMDKVESIKEQIQSGEYKVDSRKTAEAIAEDLI